MANVANISTVLSLESQSFLTGIEKSRGAVRSLIASLDPAAASAARFNRDMETLSRGLKFGQISADQFAAASARLEQRFAATATAGRQVVSSSGQIQQGFKQLGFQLNDISGGFISGIPPMQIFAQQGSQVIQAIQLMSTSTSGFLGFLAGPWGAALTAASVLLVGLAGKYFDATEATKAKADAARELKSSIDSLNQSTERQISSEGRLRNAALGSAEALLKQAAANRQAAQAEIGKQRTSLQASLVTQGLGGGSVPGALFSVGVGQEANARAAIKSLNDQLSDLKKQERDASSAVANIRIQGLRAQGDAAADKGVAATQRYQTALDKLNDRKKANLISDQAFVAEYARLKTTYDEASKAADRHSSSKAKTTEASRAAAKAARDEAREVKLTAKAAADAAAEQQSFLDRILPDAARRRQLEADSARIGRLLADGVINREAWAQAQRDIDAQYQQLVESIAKKNDQELVSIDVRKSIGDLSDDLSKQTDKVLDGNKQIRASFAETAQGIVGSLQGLASSVKGGGFLDILSGVLGVITQVAGLFGTGGGLSGVFGGSKGGGGVPLPDYNSLPHREAGGPVSKGTAYVVGERRPEIFIPQSNGMIIPNTSMLNGGGQTSVRVIPSPLFDVVVEQRAAGVVRQAAPAIASAAVNGAQAQSARRAERRLA